MPPFVGNIRLCGRKLHCHALPRRTPTFLLLSSDYHVLDSTEIALNNFIQYSH